MIGKTTLVTNAAQLIKAARSAQGGDTILLAAGNYGEVALSSMRPAGMVTIKSANPDADAVFDNLYLTRVSNFTIMDIDVHHILKSTERESDPALRVLLSDNVNLVGIDFTGSLNGNHFDDGNGLVVDSSSRVTVLDSTFRQFNNGAVFTRSSDVIFAGNSVKEVREGVNISQVDGGLFERNFITDIGGDRAKGDHTDAFQVHAGGNSRSSNDLAFRSNVIITGTDSGGQGIYIHNEQGASRGLTHTNISIENNYYQGNFRNAIAVNYTDGVVISGNTVRDGGGIGIPPAIMISNLSNATIDHNIAPLLLTRAGSVNSNVIWSDNIDVWDSTTQRGVSVASVFGAMQGTGNLDFSALEARAGSTAQSRDIGFEAVAGIGNLSGSAAAQLAAYVPQFDSHFASNFFA
ncbi:MAG: right-handed parallel beta-helix repeat-containing protein [Polymorphobacter sp.]